MVMNKKLAIVQPTLYIQEEFVLFLVIPGDTQRLILALYLGIFLEVLG